MIEDKFLAQQFVRGGDEKKRVWRVVGVNDIKTVSERHIHARRKTAEGKIHVLADITEHGPDFQPESLEPGGIGNGSLLKKNQLGQPIDPHPVDHLGQRLAGRPKGNHNDLVARRQEHLAFIPYTGIAWVVVLDEHQDSTGIFLHDRPMVVR